jgi:hypothetical protein
MDKNIMPVLDLDALQKKANDYAQKGAEEALKDFYVGYNSPYKKAIEESLKNKGVDHTIEIPDIIGHLNEAFATEVDRIANTAVSKSFLPKVKKFLTRADAEIKFSDILKEFITASRYEYNDDLHKDDYEVEITKDEGSFIYLEIKNREISYELYFYLKSKDGEPKVYETYSLPRKNQKESSHRTYSSNQVMKISLDGGATLELPFTPKVLEDDFMSYIATLIIANTQITFDTDEFDRDMFPTRNNCHCHDEDEY